MKPYIKPEMQIVMISAELSRDEIAELSDEALQEYLKKSNWESEKKRYQVRDGYIKREIAGESVIVPVNPNGYIKNGIMSPNEVASLMWDVFQKPQTKGAAVQRIVREYKVDSLTARNSVERFVEELLHYEILEEVM